MSRGVGGVWGRGQTETDRDRHTERHRDRGRQRDRNKQSDRSTTPLTLAKRPRSDRRRGEGGEGEK